MWFKENGLRWWVLLGWSYSHCFAPVMEKTQFILILEQLELYLDKELQIYDLLHLPARCSCALNVENE